MKNKLILITATIVAFLIFSPASDAGDYGKDTVWTNPIFGSIKSMDLSPDGSKVAMAIYYNDYYLQLADIATGQVFLKLEGKDDNPIVKYTPDGKYLVVKTGARDLSVHDAETLEFIQAIEGDFIPVDYCMSKKEDKMFIASWDQGVYIYDTKTWELIKQIKETEEGNPIVVWKIDPSSDGKYLAMRVSYTMNVTNQYFFRLYDLQEKTEIYKKLIYGLDDIYVSPSDSYVFTVVNGEGTDNKYTLNQYSFNDATKLKEFETNNTIIGEIDCSIDEKYLVIADIKQGSMLINSIDDGKIIYEYTDFPGANSQVRVTSDNNFIVSNGRFTKWHARWGGTDVGEEPIEDIIYPNPTNNQATIRIEVPHISHAHLEIFDNQGLLVMVFDHFLNEGVNEIPIDVSSLSNGIYLIRLSSESFSTTYKLIKE
jgi:WD40 repeat protein